VSDGVGVPHWYGCKEVVTGGIYNPVMLNRPAVDLFSQGMGMGNRSLSETCASFGVSYSIGLGVLAWIYQLHVLTMPEVHELTGSLQKNSLRAKQFAVRGLTNIHCNRLSEETTRTIQDVAVGCGSLQYPHGPVGRESRESRERDINKEEKEREEREREKEKPNIYDVDLYFTTHGEDIDLIHIETGYIAKIIHGKTHILPLVVQLTGYKSSIHSKQYDVTKQWTPFNASHCSPPGRRKRGE